MKKLAEEIRSGRRLNRSDDLSQLLTADLEELRAERTPFGESCAATALIFVRSSMAEAAGAEDCKFCA